MLARLARHARLRPVMPRQGLTASLTITAGGGGGDSAPLALPCSRHAAAAAPHPHPTPPPRRRQGRLRPSAVAGRQGGPTCGGLHPPTPGGRQGLTTSSATSTTIGDGGTDAAPPPLLLPYPRAAVAAVALRPHPSGPQALLVRRARPPHAGCWSFPGGSLELGETVVAGAARELLEECGVRFRGGSGGGGGGGGGPGGSASSPPPLVSTGPVAFTASDAIDVDPSTGALRFHYAIVQVAGLVEEAGGSGGGAVPVAGDDAAAVGWADLAALAEGRAGCAPEEGGTVTPGCAVVAREALGRFGGELAAMARS